MPQKTPHILVLTQNRRNRDLLIQFLREKEGYAAQGAATLQELDEHLDQEDCFSSALLDITGFDSSIWQRCERLRENSVPFVILSPKQSKALHQEAQVRGARNVLVKPLVMKELSALLKGLHEGED